VIPGNVRILAPEGDNEAQQLGVDFYETFKAAHWHMNDPIVMSFREIGAPIPSDVIVFDHGEPVTTPTPVLTILQPGDPGIGLKAFLIQTGFKFHFERRLGTPEGIIDIQIGPNPNQYQ
jgi:hypothetical protein